MKNWGVFIATALLFLIFFPNSASATCWKTWPQSGSDFECGYPQEYCDINQNTGGAQGIAVYSCGVYSQCLGQNSDSWGCYFHQFNCDDPCGSPGVPGGGGGGGGFVCPLARVDCPLGSVRGSTLLGSQCESYQCQSNVGSAQVKGSCCKWTQPPQECSDWYCGYKPGPGGKICATKNNPNKCCRDCTQEPPTCGQYNYETYNCVSVCSATAPTNVTFTPISLTAARLTWSPGTGGTTQYVYVGSNKPDVEANCASGSCAVSVNLGSATQSTYDTPQVLVPGTVYYYRVVNSESISCATPSVTGTHLQSCTLSPTSLSLSTSQTAVITASVGNSSEIQRVDFSSNNPSIASVSPSSDNSYPLRLAAGEEGDEQNHNGCFAGTPALRGKFTPVGTTSILMQARRYLAFPRIPIDTRNRGQNQPHWASSQYANQGQRMPSQNRRGCEEARRSARKVPSAG